MATPPPVRSSNQANRAVGPRMKIPMNRANAMISEIVTWRELSCSSSSTAWFAAIRRARVPIASDCPSTMIPRNPGLPRIGWRAAIESIPWDSTWMSPAGRRTATAQCAAPRIMTPSTTAWPP